MIDIVLVSESELRARKRVAAILDRYARRVGSDTWVTPITREGLQTLHTTLRKAATRQMSVSCFQRTPEGLTPLWSVGRPIQARPDGSIPVHRHEPSPPRLPDEWNKACLLVKAAGLAHDLGKASCDFQRKLIERHGKPMGDPVRHEWLSVHLMEALFKQMDARPNQQPPSWQGLWETMQDHAGQAVTSGPGRVAGTVFMEAGGTRRVNRFDYRINRKENDAAGHMGGICDAKSALLWLVATHHRLPRVAKPKETEGNPGPQGVKDPLSPSNTQSMALETYFRKGEAPTGPVSFLETAAQHLEGILRELWVATKRLISFDHAKFANPVVFGEGKGDSRKDFWYAAAHAVRPFLILADHEVSSVELGSKDAHPGVPMANTIRSTGDLNQTLPWHLDNVGRTASMMVREFYQFRPRGIDASIKQDLCQDTPLTHPFHWQTRVGKFLRQLPKRPTLVLNMAGTGTGKTRMNARILAELADEDTPLRFSTALNLRTLTLQTIDSYKEELGLGNHLAGVIGDRVAQRLHEKSRKPVDDVDPMDMEIDEDGNPPQNDWQVVLPRQHYEGPEWLAQALARKGNSKLTSLIMAPVAVCTADFLVEAGSLPRQGDHSLALIRIAKSDLVLDEIDSYDTQPLISLLRLVALTAFYGRNVVASSATLSLPCAKALVEAWQYGRWLRASLERDSTDSQVVMCDHETEPTLWQPEGDNATLEAFKHRYQEHITDMLGKLRRTPAKRHAIMLPTYDKALDGRGWSIQEARWLQTVEYGCRQFHAMHKQPIDGRMVSIGLVRVANIKQAILTAEHLSKQARQDTQVHWSVACYHANLPVVARHHIEKHLDCILRRRPRDKSSEDALPSNRVFQEMLSLCPAGKDALFVVVATPVEEIGRDHDFDWAVIEPSSTQSIVQTAGRVRRHRQPLPLDATGSPIPNIGLLEHPWRYVHKDEFSECRKGVWPELDAPKPCLFMRPGQDTAIHALRSDHNAGAGTFLWHLYKTHPRTKGNDLPFGALSLLLDTEHLAKVGLDAGLKFDVGLDGEPVHLFSRLDNQSQEKHLETARRFFSRKTTDRSVWSLHDAYRFYSLRPREPGYIDVSVQLPPNQAPLTLAKWGTAKVKASTFIEREAYDQERTVEVMDTQDHAWLTLSPSKHLEEWCRELGLSHEEGLTVRLSLRLSGKDDPMSLKNVRWHLSFGLGILAS